MRKTRQLKKAASPMEQMSLKGTNQNVWVCPYCLCKLRDVDNILPDDEKNADPYFLFGVESVLEYAQTLPALTQSNNWISVEDRLPEDGDGTVLVCFPDVEPYNLKEPFVNAKHDTRVKTAVYSEYSGTWIIGDMGGVSNIQPTHWRPLPEPPEED